VKKVLKWVAITLAVIVLLPLLLLVAINLFDEDLDPKAATYGEPRAATVPEAENAYYALIALKASDGADGMAYARAWHNEVSAAAKEKRSEKLPASKRAQRPKLCDSREAACLALIHDKPAEAAQQIDAYQQDLARYDTLLGYKRFEEVLDYLPALDSTMAPYDLVGSAQRAWLQRAGIDAEAGKLEETITALERDFALQRMLLGGSRTLLGKVVATANYWRGLQFVNELIQTRPAEISPYLPRLRPWLAPLDAGLLRLAPTMETEFGMMKNMLRDDRLLMKEKVSDVPVQDALNLFFLKRNASVNRYYRCYSRMGELMDAPVDRLDAEINSYGTQCYGQPEWNWVYNPMGKILQGVAMPIFSEYAWRVHDLDALGRLLALRADMLGAGVSAEQAPEFISKSAPELRNPYTQKPMSWDAEKKRIYFETKSTGVKRLKNGVENSRVFIAF
jgi:hypothetical protein